MSSHSFNHEKETYRFPVRDCLSAQQVTDYVLRAREGQVDEAVRDHLVACSKCRLLMQQTLLGEALFRGPATPSPTPRSPIMSRRGALLAALLALVIGSGVAAIVLQVPRDTGRTISPVDQPGKSHQGSRSLAGSSKLLTVAPVDQDPTSDSRKIALARTSDPHRPNSVPLLKISDFPFGGSSKSLTFAPINEDPTSDSRQIALPRMSDLHGPNSVLVLEISAFPFVLSEAGNNSLSSLDAAERVRLDEWFRSQDTIKRTIDDQAFVLLTPNHQDILVSLFDRWVIAATADRHRIFASMGRALDSDGDQAAWEKPRDISEFTGLFGKIFGTSLSNMTNTELLEYVLESVDVPILLVHSATHSELAKTEVGNYLSSRWSGPINFVE